jgi:hypothetical protein
MTSWHLRDVADGYCGKCHDWTSEPCVSGMSGIEMGSGFGGPDKKPSDISS